MKSVPEIFDVHAHLQFAAFKGDGEAAIRRALNAGVWMINVGTQRDTSAAAIRLAEKFSEGVYAAAGLHPVHTEKSYHDPQELGAGKEQKGAGGGGFVSRAEIFDRVYYKGLALSPKAVAVGECGLDYYRLGPETKEKQKAAFAGQVELAAEIKKPLMIHCRGAFPDLIGVLAFNRGILNYPAGAVHFFSGSEEDAEKLLDLGFSFSFGGVITFSRDYDAVIKYVPAERLLLETDSPYVSPEPHRGKRNEPVYLWEVARKMAEIKGLSFEEVCAKTKENAFKLFKP